MRDREVRRLDGFMLAALKWLALRNECHLAELVSAEETSDTAQPSFFVSVPLPKPYDIDVPNHLNCSYGGQHLHLVIEYGSRNLCMASTRRATWKQISIVVNIPLQL